MDITVFNEAKKAYAAGDYARALAGFSVCTRQLEDLPEEELSKFYHLVGNCYVKSGSPSEAAFYYAKALETCSEERRSALHVNMGTALLAADRDEEAIESFEAALDDESYPTPFKAFSGIGAAQLKLGDMVEAGAAYREAALDPANPNPGKALINLGVCFMELDRTEDAVVSYEAALDMGLSPKTAGKAYSNLGQAFMTQGRLADAIAAFEAATETGTELSSIAAHDLGIARTLQKRFGDDLSALLVLPEATGPLYAATPEQEVFATPSGTGEWSYETQPEPEFGEEQQAAYEPPEDVAEVDPSASTLSFPAVEADEQPEPEHVSDFDDPSSFDPGKTFGALAELDADEEPMPSPEDTAFFDISEEDINAAAKSEKKKKKGKKSKHGKKRRVWPKVLIVIIILAVLLAAACAAGYMLGYGYPTQEQVTEDFVSAVISDEPTDGFWAEDANLATRTSQQAALSEVQSFEVTAVERSANRTIVYLDTTLVEGGKMSYDVTLCRDKLSWVVESVEPYFPSVHQS